MNRNVQGNRRNSGRTDQYGGYQDDQGYQRDEECDFACAPEANQSNEQRFRQGSAGPLGNGGSRGYQGGQRQFRGQQSFGGGPYERDQGDVSTGYGYGQAGYGGSGGSRESSSGQESFGQGSVGSGGYGYSQSGSGAGAQRRGPHYGSGPQGYSRSDERIREDVCDRMYENGDVDCSGVSVSVQNGEVTLTGTVESRQDKHQIENLVASVSGVKDITNQLRISKGTTQDDSGDLKTGGQTRSQQTASTGSRPAMASSSSSKS